MVRQYNDTMKINLNNISDIFLRAFLEENKFLEGKYNKLLEDIGYKVRNILKKQSISINESTIYSVFEGITDMIKAIIENEPPPDPTTTMNKNDEIFGYTLGIMLASYTIFNLRGYLDLKFTKRFSD